MLSAAPEAAVLDHVLHLSCLICGEEFAEGTVDYVCPAHGDEGILDLIYDYDLIASRLSRDTLAESRDESMWRYRAALPLAASVALPPLRIGWTPLYEAPRLAAEVGVRQLWIKDEGLQPTGSLKDRASAIAVIKAGERRADVVTTASTGNAAAALAGVSASVGLASTIFVPATAPQAKIAQLLAFGATVLLVEGSYDQAFELCIRIAEELGWYVRNTGFNPYMSEGKKTAAFEIVEQLNWNVPDVVAVGVGDGCIIGGLFKGFLDLYSMGLIHSLPRLLGVQSAGSDFLVEAWEEDQDVFVKPPVPTSTVADSISAGLPRDRVKAMRAVRETDGAFVRVSDAEILAAIPTMACGSGVFAEPAAAAAYAGLVAAVRSEIVDAQDRCVVLSTGTGLKDVLGVMRGVSEAQIDALRITPDVDDVMQALRVRELGDSVDPRASESRTFHGSR